MDDELNRVTDASNSPLTELHEAVERFLQPGEGVVVAFASQPPDIRLIVLTEVRLFVIENITGFRLTWSVPLGSVRRIRRGDAVLAFDADNWTYAFDGDLGESEAAEFCRRTLEAVKAAHRAPALDPDDRRMLTLGGTAWNALGLNSPAFQDDIEVVIEDQPDRATLTPRRTEQAMPDIQHGKQDGLLDDDNWGSRLIRRFLHPVAVVSAPLGLLAAMFYLVGDAFTDSVSQGIRSFASVLLPLMAVTYIFTFRRERVTQTVERIPQMVAFVLSLLAGIIAIMLLSVSSSVTLRELVASGCFSVLVFSRYALGEMRSMSYYYGVVFGCLGYIVVAGFPDVS